MAQIQSPPDLIPEHKAIVTAASILDLSLLEPVLSRSLPLVDIPQLLNEYKKFLAIKVIARDTSEPLLLSPSALLERVWQAHVLSTASYRDACTALGAVIHHSHAGGEDAELVKRKRIDLTKSFYLTIFKCCPPSQFWGVDIFENKSLGGIKQEVEETNFENGDEDEEDLIHVFEGDHNTSHRPRRYPGADTVYVSEGAIMHLYVHDKKNFIVACKPDCDVGSLRRKLADVIGCKVDKLSLSFLSKEGRRPHKKLLDGTKLSNYTIQDRATIMADVR